MENETKKILIIGAGDGKTALTHQMMKEKFGDDIILYSNLTMKYITNF